MHLNEHQDSDQVMEEIKNQLFDRITMLEQKDIINFRGKLSPEKQQTFDQEDEIEQTRLVALSMLPAGDREFIAEYLSEGKRRYLVGLHDLGSTIRTFNNLLN